MSQPMGSELPERLLRRLTGPAADRPLLAVLALTIDAADWPHPALLSFGEVLAIDASQLRVAVGNASGTAANLRRSGRLTLGFVDAEAVYYVKTRVRRESALPGHAQRACFDVGVETVLLDAPHPDEPGGAVLDGIRFAARGTRSALDEAWHSTLEALRAVA